jgi:hypothetical protein
MAEYKRFEFIDEYASKKGMRVQKGEVLSAYLSKSSKNPRWMFEWYEGVNKEKADSGEGLFSIFDSELKDYAKETTNPVKRIKAEEKQQEIIPSSDQNPTNVTNKKTKKSFFQKPINLILVALAISGAGVVIYLLTRKK